MTASTGSWASTVGGRPGASVCAIALLSVVEEWSVAAAAVGKAAYGKQHSRGEESGPHGCSTIPVGTRQFQESSGDEARGRVRAKG